VPAIVSGLGFIVPLRIARAAGDRLVDRTDSATANYGSCGREESNLQGPKPTGT
jgi:hypothetical protein